MLSPALSTFAGTVQSKRIVNVVEHDVTLVALAPDEQLCVAGAVRVGVLRGCVDILGFRLTGGLASSVSKSSIEIVTVYSPFWDSSCVLRSVSLGAAADSPPAARHALLQPLAPDIASAADAMGISYPSHAVVVLFAVEGAVSGADGYQISSGTFEAAMNAQLALPGAHFLYECSSDAVKQSRRISGLCVAVKRPILIPSQWAAVVDSITRSTAPSTPCTAVVCGAKGVGKSTFCRFITNRFLSLPGCTRVALLDLDVGQPECGVPACVSLHWITQPLVGPPHTHMDTPALYGNVHSSASVSL